jgi:glyceraldehyde 3-phosphate dehydrogenase
MFSGKKNRESVMTVNIAINGFGRIGRLVYRLASDSRDLNVVAINDLVPCDCLAYLLKYDSTHGRFDKEIKIEGNCLIVNGKRTEVLNEKDPEQLPWKDLGVDYVVEYT